MNTALAYEVQKAIIEERLRKAAVVQQFTPDQPRRPIATRVRRWSIARGYTPRSVRSA